MMMSGFELGLENALTNKGIEAVKNQESNCEFVEISKESLVPVLIGFGEICHRFLEKEENKPDIIIFPARDATWMGRFYKWAYPEDQNKVKMVPWNRKTTFNERFSGDLRSLPINAFTNLISGMERVAIIDVGFKMTIPWFVRDLRPGGFSVEDDFVPPKEVLALGMNVREPNQTLKEGEKLQGAQRDTPGGWRNRDLSTMLGFDSPYVGLLSKLHKKYIADPQKFLDTIEPLLGNTQRPIEGYDPITENIKRSEPVYRSNNGSVEMESARKKLFKYVTEYRESFALVASTLFETTHTNSGNSVVLKEIKKLSDRDLVRFVVGKLAEVDKSLRKTKLFGSWLLIEKRKGVVWEELSKGLSNAEKDELYDEAMKWVG